MKFKKPLVIVGLSLGLSGLPFLLNGCASAQHAPTTAPAPSPFQEYVKALNDRVDPFWKDELKSALDNPKNAKTLIKGQNQVICGLEIQLDKTGLVRKTKIAKTSGYRIIDNAALGAIKKASPLPPPPAEWVKNKFATIRWQFVLKDQ